ncbi:sulfotransferase domain-containing protein [Fulvivirga lutea]|uniref:Sulfotransferase domain-containing protein n=1 Tax=Fulvivirga lutea TaxID=2810512 RepID=A0A974WN02_9BACT|nr:sulfotransferase domain-containing protein [Fulvivirga lutea]QSE98448.1 sulfotransferase domain-containing protein [Fulvivirga lutea]
MIIGAQKAGTTSLKNYLAEHPDIGVHITEELAYFQSENEYSKGFDTSFKRSYLKQNAKVIVAKNAGLYERELYLSRLSGHNKDCKIVFIIRNPVDRAFSSYLMEKREGFIDFDSKKLVDIISSDDPYDKNYFRKFLGLGLYSIHLQNILAHFPKENVHIFTFEELKSDAQQVCSKIFEILNIDPTIYINANKVYNKRKHIRSKRLARILNRLKQEENPLKRVSKKIIPYRWFLKLSKRIQSINYTKEETQREVLSDDVRMQLIEFYKPYNLKLSKMIGRELSDWNKVRN